MLASTPVYRTISDSAAAAVAFDRVALQKVAAGYASDGHGQHVDTPTGTLIGIVLRGFASADPSVQSHVIQLGAKAPVLIECPDEDL